LFSALDRKVERFCFGVLISLDPDDRAGLTRGFSPCCCEPRFLVEKTISARSQGLRACF